MPKKDSLPVGVGRVPQWWMEITPHYTLDLDEEEARAEADAYMQLYLQHMAAASDAGAIGPDGKPVLGPDGQPVAWNGSSGWAGRSGGGGSGDGGEGGPGGRNFTAGSGGFKIDPTRFGISKDDPDYQAYLTGAKLPPGFLDRLKEMESKGMFANNLAQTSFGQYGRQAEKPAFQPSWAKKKLRSTAAGERVRSGQYNDSPNKHLQANKEETPASPYQRSIPEEPRVPPSYREPEPESAPEYQAEPEPEEEESEEEEYEDDEDDDEEEGGTDLAALQAILDAKKAELARLQT